MPFVVGEDMKAGEYCEVGSDGKLYKQDSKKTKRLIQDEFIQSLKNNPAFKHINIEKELIRMDEWLKRHPGRMKTRLFVTKWLEKQEVPLTEVQDVPESMRKFFK